MRFPRNALLAVALLGSVVTIAWNRSVPAALPDSSASAELLKPGSYAVGTRDLELIDSTRTTDANGDFGGAPVRTLATRMWYPVLADGQTLPQQALPLIVYSHGFFGNNGESRYLSEYLASHGYLIVAAAYPLTNYKAPGGPTVFDVVNQPGDVSFLIDTVLAWNADPQSEFHARVDANRIAIAGLSLGGMTTELAAYHPRSSDPRVKAAVSIAGPLQMFGRIFFAQSQLPFMMIAGDIDAMVPYADNARPVLQRINNATLVTVKDASHTGFADQASWLRWFDNADSIGCYVIKGKTPQDSKDNSFYERIGSEQEGVLRNMENRLCRMQPLPDAISPLLQQRVVKLAVRSFLDTVFNADAGARKRSQEYLLSTLAKELDGVSVESLLRPKLHTDH